MFYIVLQEVWLSISDELIRRCINSMARRLEAVEIAHGYQTGY